MAKYRFSIYKKITLFIFISSFIVGFIGLGLVYWSEYKLLRETISRDYMAMAKLLGSAMDRIITREIASTKVFMGSGERLLKVKEANLKYEGMSNEKKEAYFRSMDQRWLLASMDDSLVTEYTLDPIGKRLKEIAQDDPTIAEIFMTDKYGGLVATSDKTSDFYQADELWWQKSFDLGKGSVFLDRAGWDESSKTISLAIAVPIKNESKEVIGVCKNILEIKRLFAPLESFTIGKSGHVGVMDERGYLIFHSGSSLSTTAKLPDKVVKEIIGQNIGYLLNKEIDKLHKKKTVIAYFKIDQPELLKSGITWWLCVTQNDDEVFAPLHDLVVSFIFAALIMLIIILLIGFLFSSILVKPIIELRDATKKIADGNLDYRVKTITDDELGDLANSFNLMLNDLKNNFTTIDQLNKEIDQRKRLQEELFFEKENLAVTLFSIGDGVIATDSYGKISLINKEAQALTGYSDVQAIGKPAVEVFNIINELTRQPCENPFAKILSTGKPIELGNHTALITKDGREIIIADSGAPIHDKLGKVVGAVLVFRDITELTRVEHALQKSEEQFRILFESSTDAVMILGSSGRFISGNPAAIKMFGCRDEEDFKNRAPGEMSPEFQLDGAKSINKSQEIIRLAMEQGSNLFEWVHKRVDGVEFIATVLLSRFEIGGKVFLQATVRDISEQNKRDKKLRELSVAVE